MQMLIILSTTPIITTIKGWGTIISESVVPIMSVIERTLRKVFRNIL